MADPYIALKNVTGEDNWIQGNIVVQSSTLNINNIWPFKTLNAEPVELEFGGAKFTGKIELKSPGQVCINGHLSWTIFRIPIEHCEMI